MKLFQNNKLTQISNMWSYLNNFFVNKTESKPNHDIIPQSFYSNLNWSSTFIGGSYALKMLTRAEWKCNDIDIFVSSSPTDKGKKEFQDYVKSIVETEKGEILKYNDIENLSCDTEYLDVEKEDFHECIRQTYTCKFPEIVLPVQFVHIADPKNTSNIVDGVLKSGHQKYIEITDVPSCVSYKLDSNGKKMFYVPQKGTQAILTKNVKKSDICLSRMEKYTKRGYTFL